VAPAPVVAPTPPQESAEDEAARREFEERHRKLEAQRAALRRILGEGATDAAEVQKGIDRLEAAVAALHAAEE
jgi:hypothetical protein